MKSTLLLNAQIINEGEIFTSDVFIKNGFIEKIAPNISNIQADDVIDLKGKYLMPGIIDDQVHFREPGLTHKANIASESKAAIAGGTTSFMEMPNTIPNALTQELLEDKYNIAKESSWANYSFFMGGSNDNYEEVMKTNLEEICGLKIFMGSSTGNMLVDNRATLEKVFCSFEGLIATHCEDEETVKNNLQFYKDKYKNSVVPYDIHALIRNEEACYKSSHMASDLARKCGTRLHILHISTGKELELFTNEIPLEQKKITAEVCVHHLYFDAEDYRILGTKIKCNPAIKHDQREMLMAGLLDNRLDIIATDHAPHLIQEKSDDYWSAHAGLPLVQHSLNVMLDFYQKGIISLERIVEKMTHAPAQLFRIDKRGFVREGYWADLVAFDLNDHQAVLKENILAKCGWSPFENKVFSSKVNLTMVSGEVVYRDNSFYKPQNVQRLKFKKP